MLEVEVEYVQTFLLFIIYWDVRQEYGYFSVKQSLFYGL